MKEMTKTKTKLGEETMSENKVVDLYLREGYVETYSGDGAFEPYQQNIAVLKPANTFDFGMVGMNYIIPVEGSITEGTQYEIIEHIENAKHEGAKALVFYIDSPGGIAAGMEDLALILEEVSIPKVAYSKNQACSGGYYLASSVDRFYTSRDCIVGSLGVISVVYNESGFLKMFGIEKKIITNEDSPNKSMDTEESFGQYRRDVIEPYFDAFLARVAKGRKREKDYVLANFGRGGVLKASNALQFGMVDGLMTFQDFKKKLESEFFLKSRLTLNGGLVYNNIPKENIREDSMEKEEILKKERERVAALDNLDVVNPKSKEIISKAKLEGLDASEVALEILSLERQTPEAKKTDTIIDIKSEIDARVKEIKASFALQNEDQEILAQEPKRAQNFAMAYKNSMVAVLNANCAKIEGNKVKDLGDNIV